CAHVGAGSTTEDLLRAALAQAVPVARTYVLQARETQARYGADDATESRPAPLWPIFTPRRWERPPVSRARSVQHPQTEGEHPSGGALEKASRLRSGRLLSAPHPRRGCG